ncbi:MAG TPA: DUF177 domain-containing protein [Terriglobia bacterium]|nr:DUF177 domain-containing protein [Terriglobia bacterium]
MTRYFVDLKDLTHEKVSFQGSFEPGTIDFADNVRQVGPLDWSASAERAGGEIRINGSLKATFEQMCSRCLEPARCEITKPFDLFFRQRDAQMFDEDEEVELTETDTRTAFFTGTQLAVGEILHEQVLLALPMKVLCRVDCKGLCATCGTNLNSGSCNCPKEDFSPHMDTLLELKRRLEQRSS